MLRKGLFLLALLCLHHACAAQLSSGQADAGVPSAHSGAGDQEAHDGELQELRRVMPGGPLRPRSSRVRQVPPGMRPARPPRAQQPAPEQQPEQQQQQQPEQQQQQLEKPEEQQQPEEQPQPETQGGECRAMQFNVAGMCVQGSLQCLAVDSDGQRGAVASVYGYSAPNTAYAAAVDAAATTFTVAFYATAPTRIDVALPDGTALGSTWVVPEDCDAQSCAACATKASPGAAVVSTQGQAFVRVSKPAGASLVRVSLHSPCSAACESGSWNMVVFCSGAATKFPSCGSKGASSP